MLLWQKANGKGNVQTMSPAYDFNHYDEWRRVGAPPRRCDEGCTSVESLRRSMRCKRKKMPRSLEPLDDAPFLRQASDELPHRPKDASRMAQSKSAVVLPPLEQKRRPSEPVNHGVARVSSGSISIDSQDSSPSTQESPAPVSPNAHSGNFTSEPAVEGLVPPEDIWMRWHFDGTGFSASELLRVRQAFDLFKYSDVSEISSEDLTMAVQHLGYFAIVPEVVDERAKEVTEYSAMNLAEFTSFLEKYAQQELADIKEAFQRHSKHSKVPQKVLLPFLHEVGFTSLQRSVFETLTASRMTMKSLTLPQIFRFLAVHRSSEGFTTSQLQAARKAFDQVRQGKDEIAPHGVGAALALLFGQDAYDKWNRLWER
ncbi:RING-type E3 ubiquitin transferase, partial [Durusdinium trenchii]